MHFSWKNQVFAIKTRIFSKKISRNRSFERSRRQTGESTAAGQVDAVRRAHQPVAGYCSRSGRPEDCRMSCATFVLFGHWPRCKVSEKIFENDFLFKNAYNRSLIEFLINLLYK